MYNPAVDVHFISAMRLQEKGNYKAAINELKQASVDLYLSYYGIGYIYLKMGDVKKAKEYLINKTEKYLKLTIENNPDYIEGYVNLFRVYMSGGQYDKASMILDIVTNKKINPKELSLMRAYYNFVVKNNYEGVEKLIELYPNSPLLNGLTGYVYMQNGELDKASLYLNRALKGYLMGSVYYDKVLTYVQRKEYKKAVRYLQKSYYMDFSKIKCKNYLYFFLLLHERKFKAAYGFLSLNKKYFAECYSKFKIVPVVQSNITTNALLERKSINYMLAAELLNMYLRPIKFLEKGTNNIRLGNLYESLGLPKKAKISYLNTASFAEAVLLSQRAAKFYAKGDLNNALIYYKRALKRVNTSPILLYDVAIMYLKKHNMAGSYTIFSQLENAYPNFPLPYFAIFIIRQLNGNHKDAVKSLGRFYVKFKALNGLNKNMIDLGVMADFLLNGGIKNDKNLTNNTKRLLLIVKAAVNDDFVFLNLEKTDINELGVNIADFSQLSVLKYFYKNYPTDFIKRTISDYYLMKHDYENAYRSLFNINQYSSADYYKLGIAYLMDGYPDAADNFLTKSILLSDGVYNAYFAKVILQAQSGDYNGVVYYLKMILKKDRGWMNMNAFLSFDIELK